MFEVEKKKIKTLFNETKSFVIPDFQRSFSWGVEEVDEFFEDLKSEPLFFIGSFILKISPESRTEKVEIIDGQQRTVTISLFKAALSYCFEKTATRKELKNAKVFAQKLKESIAEVNPKSPTDVSKFKIDFKDEDTNNFFASILSRKGIDELPSDRDLYKKVKKVYKRIIESIEQETGLDYQKLVSLKEKIEETEAIVITIQKEELAYQIFETVNARGVDLTVAELLKNHLFKTILDRGYVKSRWEEIVDNLGKTGSKQLNLSIMLRFYWICHFDHTTKKRLYRAIKDAIKDGKITEQTLLDQIHGFSKNLSKVYEQDQGKWETFFPEAKSQERRQAVRWFFYKNDSIKLFPKSIQYLPIVVSLLGRSEVLDITSSSFRNLIHVMESINFIYLEILGLPGNVLEKKYSEFSRKINFSKTKEKLDKQIADLYKELKALIDRQASNKEEVKRYISSLNYENKKDKDIIRFIFSRIEYLRRDFGVIINEANFSLEHISSQSEIDLEDEADIKATHSIGNLTPMQFSGRDGNGAQNDKPFKHKKIAYEKSPYSLTVNVAKQSDWNTEDINKRTDYIAELVWKIWGSEQETKNFDL